MIKAILLASFLSTALVAAPDHRPELEPRGWIKRVTISPIGEIWVSTGLGQLYRSSDSGHSWSEVITPARGPESGYNTPDSLQEISFFDDHHALLVGNIGQHGDSILRTSDNGATWEFVEFPYSTYIHHVQSAPDGKAWIIGSAGDILQSSDYGKSWRAMARSYGSNIKISTVHFAPEGLGVAVTELELLKLTQDGGESWTDLETPAEQLQIKECNRTPVSDRVRYSAPHLTPPIEAALISGGVVYVTQCQSTFWRDQDGQWLDIRPGQKMAIFAKADGKIAGVTKDRKIVLVTNNGSVEPLDFQLERAPVDIAIAGNQLAAVDSSKMIATFDGSKWHKSRLLGQDHASQWPIRSMTRASDGTFWGLSEYFLYRSSGGHVWERLADLPYKSKSLAIQSNGDILIWGSSGWVGRWKKTGEKLIDDPQLNLLDLNGSFRRSDLWILFGEKLERNADYVPEGRPLKAGRLAKEVSGGFVIGSRDGGATWHIMDLWPGDVPKLIFLSDEDELTILSSRGMVRQGRLSLGNSQGKMRTVISSADKDRHFMAPFFTTPNMLNLLSKKKAWIFAHGNHMESLIYQSTNNGQSWSRVDAEQYPVRKIFRLFDGTWLGFAPPKELLLWDGERFTPYKTLPAELEFGTVDSTGNLLLRLKDKSLWIFQVDIHELLAL